MCLHFTCRVTAICFNLPTANTIFTGNKSHSSPPSHDTLSLLFHQESSFTAGPRLLEGGGGDLVGEHSPGTGEVTLRGGEEEEAFPGAGLHLELTWLAETGHKCKSSARARPCH